MKLIYCRLVRLLQHSLTQHAYMFFWVISFGLLTEPKPRKLLLC